MMMMKPFPISRHIPLLPVLQQQQQHRQQPIIRTYLQSAAVTASAATATTATTTTTAVTTVPQPHSQWNPWRQQRRLLNTSTIRNSTLTTWKDAIAVVDHNHCEDFSNSLLVRQPQQRRYFSSSSSNNNNANNNNNNNNNHSGGRGGGGGPNQPNRLPPWMHPQSNEKGHYLEQYTIDLTAMAASQQLDPVIGRQDEIRRCLQILARRTKCNPVLIGEAGVGKTAIAEGLAQRIYSGQVPDSMKHKRVLSLDLAAILAGAGIRGQFEERVRGIIKDVQEEQGNIILFVDEIHTIVTAGGSGSGESMDLSNMLKPALARGELQLMGATTLQEYRIIEKDPALTRRLQTVHVSEPNTADTLSILRGLKTSYELHHSIRIKDEALIAAVSLSDRYLPDRKQPDKSIDLMDEACSKLRLELESKPEVIWQLEQELMTRQIELSALDNEEDPDAKVILRRNECRTIVQQLKNEVQHLTDAWQMEKEELNHVQEKKEQLERAKIEMELARGRGDYNRAAELLHGTIPAMEQELSQLVTHVDNNNRSSDTSTTNTRQQPSSKSTTSASSGGSSKMLVDSVTADVIATIVARQTGIPVSRITTGSIEAQQLLHIEDTLRQRVIGQDHVLTSIANCVRLARTNLHTMTVSSTGSSGGRTMGNFLFLGPTGVGKTETAKALSELLFHDSNAMTRIDMSEYNEKHTVSRLIGAPPGYIGYEDAGLLTESVRRRPYQIILLDEFEKAHPSIWNILLQIFDEGHLTDTHGRKVDFRNTIVIMTSNLGAHAISELPEEYHGSEPVVYDTIMNIVRTHLSPELLNRIDECIVFNRLQRSDMDNITNLHLNTFKSRLEEQQNMTLQISTNAQMVISEMGYDIRYGARPLKRVIAREILNPLSLLLLEGAIVSGDTIRIQTRAEAEMEEKNTTVSATAATNQEQPKQSRPLGWMSSNPSSNDKNDIVIMRNHDISNETTDDQGNDGSVMNHTMDDDILIG